MSCARAAIAIILMAQTGSFAADAHAGSSDEAPAETAFLDFVCEGANFESPAGRITYDVMVSGSVLYNKKVDPARIIKYIDDRWALNRPRDTWKCTKFETGEQADAYGQSLINRGYKGWLGDGPSNMWVKPPNKIVGLPD